MALIIKLQVYVHVSSRLVLFLIIWPCLSYIFVTMEALDFYRIATKNSLVHASPFALTTEVRYELSREQLFYILIDASLLLGCRI